jgi:hypothetical protein
VESPWGRKNLHGNFRLFLSDGIPVINVPEIFAFDPIRKIIITSELFVTPGDLPLEDLEYPGLFLILVFYRIYDECIFDENWNIILVSFANGGRVVSFLSGEENELCSVTSQIYAFNLIA